MTFQEAIKAKIGPERYSHIDKEARNEVTRAMQMPLKDEHGQDRFYRPRFLLREFLADCESFEKAKLNVLPMDILDVLFRCKLLFAAKTEHEYRQRGGGGFFWDNFGASPTWLNRAEALDALESRYIGNVEGDVRERTLLTYISSFVSKDLDVSPQQAFFEDLFASFEAPFVIYLDGTHLIEKHKSLQPGLRNYELAEAKDYFSAPSIGFTVSGTRNYCLWYGSTWLRTFLNVLRIAAYIYPAQMEFFLGVQIEPPKFPVFLGAHAQGSYQWNEDAKESWEKIPDGSLFRSFGFRGLSKMWLDRRNFRSLKGFMVGHKIIFDHLKNPWSTRNIHDVAPTLDILSSATQIPDLGAKILLIYCCLEHLFVPATTGAENSKYIIGGLHALGPHLVPWFGSLYRQRCGYAHKGFVLKNEKTMSLIRESMKNVMSLLAAKLSVSC